MKTIEEVKDIMDRYFKALRLELETEIVLDYEETTPGIEVDKWIVLYFHKEHNVWAIDVAMHDPGDYDTPPDVDVDCAATFDPEEYDKAIEKVIEIPRYKIEFCDLGENNHRKGCNTVVALLAPVNKSGSGQPVQMSGHLCRCNLQLLGQGRQPHGFLFKNMQDVKSFRM